MSFAIVMHHYIDIRVVALAAPIPPEWWKLLVIQMHNSRKQRDGGGIALSLNVGPVVIKDVGSV